MIEHCELEEWTIYREASKFLWEKVFFFMRQSFMSEKITKEKKLGNHWYALYGWLWNILFIYFYLYCLSKMSKHFWVSKLYLFCLSLDFLSVPHCWLTKCRNQQIIESGNCPHCCFIKNFFFFDGNEWFHK